MPDAKQPSLFELANQLDAICDRFEAAWRGGRQPRIEEYLQAVVEPDRAALLQELLAFELELLTKSGRPADETACFRRFPQYADVVRAVFADSSDYAFFGKLRDYELQQKLGEGGMGVVYKAVHSRLKRPVAIKLLPPEKLARSLTDLSPLAGIHFLSVPSASSVSNVVVRLP